MLIKLIRVIANLSINQDIGPLIASNENCVDQLMQILGEKCFRATPGEGRGDSKSSVPLVLQRVECGMLWLRSPVQGIADNGVRDLKVGLNQN